MKKIYQIAVCIALCFAIALKINAQPFNAIGVTGDWNTPNTVNGIAVGTYTSTPFNSAFEIHGESMPTTTGEVFRTNGKASTATYWRMFRDVSGTPTEFGTIYNNNDNHFYLEAAKDALWRKSDG